jgi:hypothetical protein
MSPYQHHSQAPALTSCLAEGNVRELSSVIQAGLSQEVCKRVHQATAFRFALAMS